MIQILTAVIFTLAPPTNVQAFDTPNDGGGSITLKWQLSADDTSVTAYEIFRSENGIDFLHIGQCGKGRSSYEDKVKDKTVYFYRVAAVSDTIKALSNISREAISYPQWINAAKLNIFIAMFIFGGLILYFIYHARKGKELFIRRIAGLQAIDDAVGRATEM